MNKIELIRNNVSQTELLERLAEEADRLADAARVLQSGGVQGILNIRMDVATDNLLEACAEISLVFDVLGFDTRLNRVKVTRATTKARDKWAESLEEAAGT